LYEYELVRRIVAACDATAPHVFFRRQEILDPGCVKTSSQVCVASQFAGGLMKRFIEGADRSQATLLPECLDDWVDESNPVRVVDAFVDALDLKRLSFDGMVPEVTGRPSYHPSALLKLYIYGYLNRIQSSRRLEREAKRNLEVIWLVRRLTPDDKTIADFRKKQWAQFLL
jgi:transposase